MKELEAIRELVDRAGTKLPCREHYQLLVRDLKALLPALDADIAVVGQERNALKQIVRQQNEERIKIIEEGKRNDANRATIELAATERARQAEAEIAALKKPMACGHPKACWIEDEEHMAGMAMSAPAITKAHCAACSHERLTVADTRNQALEEVAGICDFAANGTIEAMSEAGRSETWKILAQNSVEQYRSIAEKARALKREKRGGK